ncbi:putative Aminotransferase, class III pyridoxal-phosphate dependent [Rhodospirillaceae bacterium LM-1]|nr:putative Aminotransferase, class III pyridoxal-phosphate dependent [Rhodospirillaceae bacterium LM-1]
MRAVAIIQARMQSTRFPGKVLANLGGQLVLDRVVLAAKAIFGIDEVIVATTTGASDQPVTDWCAAQRVGCYRGSEQDVLSRYFEAAKQFSADLVMRITADCPLLDPFVCGQVLALSKASKAAYASNVGPATWPDGLDCEVISISALQAANEEATQPSEREHVTTFIRNNRHRFPSVNLRCPLPDLHSERWTLDTPQDFEFLESIFSWLPANVPISYLQVLSVLERYPDLRSLNSNQKRNGGLTLSLLKNGIAPSRGFDTSKKLSQRAERVIPLGSQTFSKSSLQFPEGKAPLLLTHGFGGRVWDVDGNEFVDMVCALAPVVLGYCDPDVDRAIINQLDSGISLSLSTTLEADLAERMVDIIPCAEKVRFGKNGSDATAGAVRVARAFAKRDRIIVCGYHGWQDWYIGSTTRSKGVPTAVQQLTHHIPYNDLNALAKLLKQHPGEFAGVIMEPMNVAQPNPGYLESLIDTVHADGGLVIFDEVVTGFRYALGGAQSLFGVKPDLACFGKAMANGMPLSAVTGRADVMREMEDIFFSFTFGGEALSLAASIAVIDKMRREPVIERLWGTGTILSENITEIAQRHRLNDIFSLVGKPCWSIPIFNDHPNGDAMSIKTLFLQEMLKRNILIIGSHNISYAHDQVDIERTLAAYDQTFAAIAQAIDSGDVRRFLGGPVLEPIFKVR